LGYQSANFSFIAKPNLTFGRVNIYIDNGRIDFHEQATDRIPALHQGRVVAFQQGKI
jgi:hypothetical protein